MSAPLRWPGAATPGLTVVFMHVSCEVACALSGGFSACRLKALDLAPISSVRRTSVQYIQISETQTTPYISMKALERMPVRSISAPNMIGSTKPPMPPARPTMPLTVPMLVG